ncbi:protein NUCLEAR FUSION DEFECTIVE 6, mitochondrial isoform X2 [Gastrolobium bilobum]|uniref:protein NUCLEAR FUSION DEFECTIVE 6, mitochondrial isoform X2 n=1 Tax=Gastrolobium bilobum TaxID=150636 RepID=UPI002AB1F881|nr:protein NUCLEAR FUSION DEFECTIVE 6, mitochondrial isoform X2 [Gastrolobium bilobum]
MATSKVLCRLSCRLQVHAHNKLTKPSLSMDLFHLKPTPPLSATARRLSPTSRLPVELGSCESMMPLHSAVASARLVSSLSIESLGWGLVPQGISMPL